MKSLEKLAPTIRQKGNNEAPLSSEAIESVVVICRLLRHCWTKLINTQTAAMISVMPSLPISWPKALIIQAIARTLMATKATLAPTAPASHSPAVESPVPNSTFATAIPSKAPERTSRGVFRSGMNMEIAPVASRRESRLNGFRMTYFPAGVPIKNGRAPSKLFVGITIWKGLPEQVGKSRGNCQ
ncbi:hypothetical protein [Pseudomonas asplenii]|uniref:hypothetical protein n=1 Tax=Pseudomonas asplenii TaxID=53407 RepID=UPI002361436C|nr:hypothetical protein [Pseudomonas asplenii]